MFQPKQQAQQPSQQQQQQKQLKNTTFPPMQFSQIPTSSTPFSYYYHHPHNSSHFYRSHASPCHYYYSNNNSSQVASPPVPQSKTNNNNSDNNNSSKNSNNASGNGNIDSNDNENSLSSDLISSLLPSSSEHSESHYPLSHYWNNIFNPLNNHQKLIPYQNHSVMHCGSYFNFGKNKLLRNILLGRFNDEVRWFLEEIFIMTKSPEFGSKEFKGIITNTINTLKGICVQQISPRCVVNIAKISMLINKYQSVSEFSEAVLLMTLAPKSQVCVHLLSVACDKRSGVFQRYLKVYKNTNPTGNDAEDVQTITKHISEAAKTTDDAELRQQMAFVVGQFYRRKLGLAPEEDLKNANSIGKMNKTNKVQLFEGLWTRLLALANVLGGKSKCLEISVNFRKRIFEERNYFDNEILCLISAIESIFATARQKRLPLIYSKNEEREKFKSTDWIKNHTNVIKEKHEKEKEEEEEKEPKIRNEDLEWTKVEWKMKYEEIQEMKKSPNTSWKRPKRVAPLLCNENQQYKKALSSNQESVCHQLTSQKKGV